MPKHDRMISVSPSTDLTVDVSDDTVIGLFQTHTNVHECDESTNVLVLVSVTENKLHSTVDT
jgi:hypothetical protein